MGINAGRSRSVRRGAFVAGIGALLTLVGAPAASAYDADITRTTGGVAHIKATTIGDGAFGVGYAAAQDSICTLADEYLSTSGERSKYLGAVGSNLNQDLFWKSIIDDRVIEKRLDRAFPDGPSQDARKMARGYAAGYNEYLADQGGKDGISDPRCKGKDWVRPISEIDEWRLGLSQAMRASSNTNLAGLVAATPPGIPATRGARRDADEPVLTEDQIADNLEGTIFDPRAEPTLGSNAIGLGADATRSGNGMVLGNPHFPWKGGDRFWEFQLTVPGEVDVVGAALMGSPAVNIGHNRHVAWSHTVSTGRRFTFHKLNLLPGDPTSYVVDGDTYKMRKQTVTVQVKDLATGALSDVSHDWYFTRYGRVSNYAATGYTWTAQNAYAYNDANGENLRLFDQWLAMNKARTAQELIDSQKRIGGIPWVNTIGADDRGTAFYTDLSVAPHATNAQLTPGAGSCVPAGTPTNALALRLYTLDGSRKACDLGTDADSVTPGVFGGDALPVLKNRTYVQNSNDSHWQTNPDTPLTGYPVIVGSEQGTQGLRTRLGIDIVRKRLADTDGLLPGRPKFTLDTLERSWTQTRNLGAELTLPGLRQLCQANAGTPVSTGTTPPVDVDISAACPVLNAFDGSGRRDSAGGWLFARWFEQAPNTSAAFWTVPFNPADVPGTPNTLNQNNATSRQALARAVKELRDRNIPLNATWGDVQKTTRGTDRIAIGGCNTGCYPVTAVSLGTTDYGEVTTGSSIVMFSEVDPVTGPRSRALLSYSQSEDPTSPYYRDQTDRFSNNAFIDLPYTAEEIAAAKLTSATVTDGAPPEGQGPAGPAGPGGTDGAAGPGGAQAAPGPQGTPVPKGTPGQRATPGPQGPRGPKGATGRVVGKVTAIGKVRRGTRRVVVRILTGGRPVRGRVVILKVGARSYYRARTDAKGYARFERVARRGAVRISSVR